MGVGLTSSAVHLRMKPSVWFIQVERRTSVVQLDLLTFAALSRANKKPLSGHQL